MNKVIAVQDLQEAGAIVYWRLTGTVQLDAMRNAWIAAGLDASDLPKAASPDTALHRALKGYTDKHTLLRRLPSGAGWALVDEVADSGGLDYYTRYHVKLDKLGRVELDRAKEYAAAIETDYFARLGELTYVEISRWMVDLVAKCNGIALRDSGGVYFIPRDEVAKWKKAADVLRGVSDNLIFEIPALQSEDAISSILDALHEECARDVAKLAELDDLGERALQTRAKKAEAMLAKVRRYEGLMGQQLDAMPKRIEDLQASIAVAIMQLGEEEAA